MVDSSSTSAARDSSDASASATATVVERNVRALVEHAAGQERAKSTGERLAATISGFIGSMKFVYLHVIGLALWAGAAMGWIPGLENVGLTLSRLGTIASLEAIFVATFVLIAQNRMVAQQEVRNHLDVQVSLLNEHETTHILRLVAAMSEKMGLPEARDPEIQELIRDVEPTSMIDQIAEHSDAVEEEIRKQQSGA